MRHSMKRAIAFVLSLTMVLSLPMAASASGVQDLFDVDAQVAGEGSYDSGSATDTGSDTGSDTSTRPPVFKPEEVEKVLPSILKVVLDKTEMELDAGGLSGELRADLIYDKTAVEKEYKDLISLVKFRTYYKGRLATSNEYLKLDWSKEEARTGVARCDIHARKQGNVQVFAFFDANNNGKLDPGECVSEEITVKITELANDNNTKFYKDLTFYEGQKVDLNALIDNANTTSWEALEGKLSWSVSDDSVVSGKTTKTATVDAKGVATMKKEGSAKFFAVGKKHNFAVEVTIDKKANGNTIKSFNADPSSKKQELIITDGTPSAALKVSAKATTKADASVLNDYVTWTVKNPKNKTVVEVVSKTANVPGQSTAANTVFEAEVKGLDVGKATVTATSSTGKKVNFTVTVKAPLNKLTITNTDQVLYTGQSVKLNAVRDPKINQDKLTWKVVGAGDGKPVKDVKVNKDGLLTIGKNPSAKDGGNFKVIVSAKGLAENKCGTYEFAVKKLYLKPVADSTKIKDVMPAGAARMVVPQTNTYSLADADLQKFNIVDDKGAEVENPPVSVADLLTWSSSKAKALSVDAKGNAEALTAGKRVKVTASALIVTKIKANGDAVVASQKTAAKLVDIVMPVTSLTVKKSVLGVTPNTTGRNPKPKKVTLQVAQQLPKGCTKEVVTWSVLDGGNVVPEGVLPDTKPSKPTGKGVLTIPANATNGCITVQAKAENGATVTQKVYVTAKTSKVAFTEKENIKPLKANTAGKKGTISLGQQGILGCDVQKKTTDTNTLLEPIVSCTVTGKGGAKVELRKDGKLVEDGKYVREGNEVWITPLRAGNVTIKVTTASGKSASYTLTINGKVEAGKTEK